MTTNTNRPGRCEDCGETLADCARLRAENRARKALARFPVLARLLSLGLVSIEGREYVGRAADGETVSVGTVGEEPAAERYLSNRPNPSQW